MVFQTTLRFKTGGHGAVHDLTPDVERAAAASGLRTGIIHVFNVGSTGAVGAMEFEPGLAKDLPEMLDRLIPADDRYHHELAWRDGNGHSHLHATLLGPSLMVPLRDARPALGTWQQVFHLECDNRPHTREVVITISGE